MKLTAVGAVAALASGLIPMQCAPAPSPVTATVTFSTNGGSYAQVHVVGTAGGDGRNHVQTEATCADGTKVLGPVATVNAVGATADSTAHCTVEVHGKVIAYGWRMS